MMGKTILRRMTSHQSTYPDTEIQDVWMGNNSSMDKVDIHNYINRKANDC